MTPDATTGFGEATGRVTLRWLPAPGIELMMNSFEFSATAGW